MRIAVLANLKENAPYLPDVSTDGWDDLDSRTTIDELCAAIEAGGHEATFIEARFDEPWDLVATLRGYKPDLCFNIAEGHRGEAREAQVPALLEALGIPYTASGPLALALTLDKELTKQILDYHGVPTPAFCLLHEPDDTLPDRLLALLEEPGHALFLKPSREGTGIGVSAENIVRSRADLRRRASELIGRYQQPVLCEEYIAGRELTVGVLGNCGAGAGRGSAAGAGRGSATGAPTRAGVSDERALTILPALEVDLAAYGPSEGGVYTNRIKVELAHEFRYLCPAPIDSVLESRLADLTREVFRLTGCRDVARVDFRVDERGPWVLEVNPLPGLNWEYSDLCIEARAFGWDYPTLVNTIIDTALRRRTF